MVKGQNQVAIDIPCTWGIKPENLEPALYNLKCSAYRKNLGDKRINEFLEIEGPEGKLFCIYSMRQGYDCEIILAPKGYKIVRRMKVD